MSAGIPGRVTGCRQDAEKAVTDDSGWATARGRAARLIFAILAAVVLFAAFGGYCRATAASRAEVSVTRHSDEYYIHVTAHLPAEPAAVYRALTDYDTLGRLNPDVLQLDVEQTGGGRPPHLRAVFRVCLLGFCRHVLQVMTLRESPPHRVSATIVADGTDFVAGEAEWTLSHAADGTRIEYRARFLPRFWLPPVLGPWLLRSWLERDVRATLHGLHVLSAGARSRPAPGR